MMISKSMNNIKDEVCLFMGGIRGSNNSAQCPNQHYKYDDKALNIFRTKHEIFYILTLAWLCGHNISSILVHLEPGLKKN